MLGAAAATAVRGPGIASATPAETVGLLGGHERHRVVGLSPC